MFDDKTVLVTGGTGSFGQRMVATLLDRYKLRKLIIFSRDELKQVQMERRFPEREHPCLRYFIGDVREVSRLHMALREVDYVIHAAALKHVPVAEFNPFEAVKTNVLGTQNLIQACIDAGVKRVVALSTDKAANPINLYGATKLCGDKLLAGGNVMSGAGGTCFSIARYGNVAGSRGSVIPFFLERKETGVLPVTDRRMTRFSITLQEAVDFVVWCMENMAGGETFVPKLPSYRLLDMAEAVAPGAKVDIVGIRPGEKIHEVMVPLDEAWHTLELSDRFIIMPYYDLKGARETWESRGAQPCPDEYAYASGTNTEWLSVEDLRELVERYKAGAL